MIQHGVVGPFQIDPPPNTARHQLNATCKIALGRVIMVISRVESLSLLVTLTR